MLGPGYRVPARKEDLGSVPPAGGWGVLMLYCVLFLLLLNANVAIYFCLSAPV